MKLDVVMVQEHPVSLRSITKYWALGLRELGRSACCVTLIRNKGTYSLQTGWMLQGPAFPYPAP